MFKKKPNKITSQFGFTIVELLIVIVIIGVLAALVIVSYNGIQARANNQTTISAVTQHIKSLKLYQIDNSAWPSMIGAYPCIGESYPAQDGATLDSCGLLSGSCSGAITCTPFVVPSYNTDIKKYTNNANLPTPSMQPVTFNGFTYRGAWAHASSLTGDLDILYFLKGNVSCEAPGGITATQPWGTDSNGTACLLTIAV